MNGEHWGCSNYYDLMPEASVNSSFTLYFPRESFSAKSGDKNETGIAKARVFNAAKWDGL